MKPTTPNQTPSPNPPLSTIAFGIAFMFSALTVIGVIISFLAAPTESQPLPPDPSPPPPDQVVLPAATSLYLVGLDQDPTLVWKLFVRVWGQVLTLRL